MLKDIRLARQRLENALKGLTDTDMVKAPVTGGWSGKDILAHIVSWEQSFIKWYQTGLRGEKQVMPVWDQPGVLDDINRQIYERNVNLELSNVKKEFHASYKLILKTVEKVSEEAMFTPARYDWTGKDTLADYIWVNTGRHYFEHLAAIESIKKNR